ncbi:hypothetical protein [Methanoculleus sp. UBA303]|uniref:hypothetical protein n=1 Tax=Methanoculleus sp. UBA303 TaxID=1915497 RepID=UPI0025E6F973|nr:hypothetical protein [Methanoculleus sp. UBA303]
MVSVIAVLCIGMIAPLAAALPVSGGDVISQGSPDSTAKATTDHQKPTEKAVETKPAALAITSTETTEPTSTVTTSPTATASLEPTATGTVYADGSDDDEEPEETVAPIPTLEREAPPRPGATMAKAHQSHDRPLVQSDHQLVNPASPFTPVENETGTPPEVVVPRDGLIVKGVGILLDRTPEDVALTRSGVEIANLDWLLDPAMRLGGRHPRAAFEGETFTVTVTVEARNLTLTGEDPACVVLVPPPGEIGVYEIVRTKEPRSLRDGERGVWEFSVVTRTGRLTLENLTLPEERLVTNLTSNPDLFAFRAYAFAGNQEHPSTALSDPVIAVRSDEGTGVAEESSLPALYALLGGQDSTLRPSETMTDAWRRGVDYDAITAGAAGYLDALRNLGKEEVAAIYAGEGKGGAGEPAGSSSSPLDLIAGFFSGLFGWFGETLHLASP